MIIKNYPLIILQVIHLSHKQVSKIVHHHIVSNFIYTNSQTPKSSAILELQYPQLLLQFTLLQKLCFSQGMLVK